MKLLVIGHNFPEPTTTAAGRRMMQLLQMFDEEGYDISFASTAKTSIRSVNLHVLKISVIDIELNDSSFDVFVNELNPTVVIFDRYITEEQFGWRVAEQCPNAMRILDTEDLHFLRKARQEAVKVGVSIDKANLYTNTAKRELASILRSDISLLISEVEVQLLNSTFNISDQLLYYLPFLVEPILEEEKKSLNTFSERSHFVTIGNFLHAPNLDSIKYLKSDIWPVIKGRIPEAELHIYGDYAPQQIIELHNAKEGFLIKGWAEDAHEVLKKARVCLAPLRFGAGLKGKFIDAMQCGTPIVTTSIGAEGMFDEFNCPGGVSDSVAGISNCAELLYGEPRDWMESRQTGFSILENKFRKDKLSEAFKEKLQYLLTNLNAHRNNNFVGQVLQHQSTQATKYMSKWIEEKNR